MLRLHHHPLSSYSRKVRSAMLHRGDVHESVVIDALAGAHKTPEFARLSPFGKIPVLEAGDEIVIESTSIIEYLEEKGPIVLLPAGSERIARHYDRLGDLYLVDPSSAMWRRPGSEQALAAPALAQKAWGLFMRRLESRPFVCGDRFSLGDLGAAIATDYLMRIGVTPPGPIAEWATRCLALPAMKQSLDEGMPFMERMLASRAPATDS